MNDDLGIAARVMNAVGSEKRARILDLLEREEGVESIAGMLRTPLSGVRAYLKDMQAVGLVALHDGERYALTRVGVILLRVLRQIGATAPDTARGHVEPPYVAVVVDDDETEVARVKGIFPPGGEVHIIGIVAQTPAEAMQKIVKEIGDRCVDLFALDMFLPRGPIKSRELSSKRREESAIEIDNIAEALRTNLAAEEKTLLSEGHATITRLHRLFISWCDDFGQSQEGGFDLMARVQVGYPTVPVLFYSRKATVADVKAAVRRGAWDVLLKPAFDEESHPEHGVESVREAFRRAILGQRPTWLS